MVATLQSRKDALEAKIAEKTAELKALCLQEADLTGTLPSETPLEPGEPPPTIRKRVGTSFSFPQSLINNLNNSEDTLGALELECKVQTNIAEAALNLANDPNASKAVRRKHRLMYRQSQRNLTELETRLDLLKQGRHQPLRQQQIKKKPRPNTIDHAHLLREYKEQKLNMLSHGVGTWPNKPGLERYEDEYRQLSGSQSSNSPRLSAKDLSAFNCSGLPTEIPTITSSLSQPNVQDARHSSKRTERSSGRRQWDTQSAGGTLLPNQTYPESHQPNLNRAHSLGSVSVDGQRQSKEKEWYETSLDCAPSPPLRTSSRLPTSARLQYHLKEMQIRDAVNRSLNGQRSHPTLTRAAGAPTTVRSTPVDQLMNNMQGMHISTASPTRHHMEPDESHTDKVENHYNNEQSRFDHALAMASPKLERSRENLHAHRKIVNQDSVDGVGYEGRPRTFHEVLTPSQMHFTPRADDSHSLHEGGQTSTNNNNSSPNASLARAQFEAHARINQNRHDNSSRIHQSVVARQYEHPPSRAQYMAAMQARAQYEALTHARVQHEPVIPTRVQYEPQPRLQYDTEFRGHFEAGSGTVGRVQYNPDDLTVERVEPPQRPRHLHLSQHASPSARRTYTRSNSETEAAPATADAVYINIPDEVDTVTVRRETPTQPYFHSGGGRDMQVRTPAPMPGLPEIHPPHAVTHEEITFDTVVPFESPQNHTVVQAGIWQPYREVTKPFEMSDFYKYSTKFRQAKQSPAPGGPERAAEASPDTPPVVGVYRPLRPMTCQPLERTPHTPK